ncbi:T9SS type A sorting domain-containing protein [Algibacter sp. 2305UL17-15]|uniref:T9SS type A sorting domain-containing protein n=1 Tax=Algibacter sp. 2305UL17-15 TaxID=3231268 RepID=UPI00345A2452
MRQILFFLTLFALGGILNAQTEFTGAGDGHSWDDPFNWDSGEVPDGEDVLIEGHAVDYHGGIESVGSVELRGGANLLVGGSLYLYGDFTVDASSTLSIGVGSDGRVDQVSIEEESGNYYFNGSIDIFFNGFVPQIGDEFEFIHGAQGSCGTSTTVTTADSPSTGFQVILGTQCEADGVNYVVTDINYTTAIQWDGEGGDGLWNNPANWDPDGIPPANSLLIFNLPGAGGYANTNGAGTTTAYNIKVGKNNTLAINGDLSMTSTIYNNPEGTIVWNAGELSKSNPAIQSLLISYGTITMGSGLKKLDGNVEIWSFGGVINHDQGNLEINNGKIRLFNDTAYNVGNNVSIGYSSGALHDFEVGVRATVKKDNSTGTSTFNLTNLVNNGKVICETGTLAIDGGLTTGVDIFNFYTGSYSGSGTIGFPAGHNLDGDIFPGSSPGVLTILEDLTTGADATFKIEIDGPTAGTAYDQIIVTDTAVLDGTIEIDLGYLPANDASFEILKATTLSSCNFPSQITTNFGGTPYTFDVICQNNTLYLNGPGATLSSRDYNTDELLVFPNPVKDVLNIKTPTALNGKWELINHLGQKVLEGKLETSHARINVRSLPSNLYLLQIKDNLNTVIKTHKVIVN